MWFVSDSTSNPNQIRPQSPLKIIIFYIIINANENGGTNFPLI